MRMTELKGVNENYHIHRCLLPIGCNVLHIHTQLQGSLGNSAYSKDPSVLLKVGSPYNNFCHTYIVLPDPYSDTIRWVALTPSYKGK